MAKSKSKEQKPAAASTGLSSFLLGQAAGAAAPLDDLFASSLGATTAFEPKKDLKRPASPPKTKSKAASTSTVAAGTAEDDDEVLSELGSDVSLGDLEGVESESEDEAGVEEAYAARLAAERIKKMQGKAVGATAKGALKRKAEEELSEEEDDAEEGSDEDEDEELHTDGAGMGDINDLILGSLGAGSKHKKDVKGKSKADKKMTSEKASKRAAETPEERDARTIFLGNVPAECSTNKSLKKALVRHVLQNPTLADRLPSSCPASLLKLDSIRFRSIAFASKVFGRKANSAGGNPNDIDIGPSDEAGGRGRKRAREWREAEGSDERGVKGGFKAKEERPSRDGKSGALTDAQKRRVAFIRGELNEGKKICNAYLVLEALPEEVDVRAVVQAIVSVTNNSIFNGVTLHADAVRPRSAAAILAAAQMAAKPNADLTNVPKNAPGEAPTVSAVEAKRTLFIGGLDFAENEENVRSATEAVLVRERGEANEGERYVENVRIVRDASSGLGKGFCYVLLQDEQCVDELLALPPGKNLKISKRKVRLERCKTTAAAARAKARTNTASSAASSSRAGPSSSKSSSGPRQATRLAAPRDPSLKKASTSAAKAAHQAELAAALAALPTDERKKVKSLDSDRIARRAQKKEQKRLAERFERKQANAAKKAGGGAAGEILGRKPRAMERARKEKKRIRMESKSTLKKKSAR